MGTSYHEFHEEMMKDPKFRAEWEAQEPDRQLMYAIVEGR